MFSPCDCLVMEELGCKVLSVNEQCRREVKKPTLFYMARWCGILIHMKLKSHRLKFLERRKKKKKKNTWLLSLWTFFSLVFSLDQSSNWASKAKAHHRGGSLTLFCSISLVPYRNSPPIGMNSICWVSVCRFRSRWGGGVIVGFAFVSYNRYEVVACLLGLGLQSSDWLWSVWGVGFGFVSKVLIRSIWDGGDFARIGSNPGFAGVAWIGSELWERFC